MSMKGLRIRQINDFWCHYCQISFKSDLQVGKQIILCPQCNNDFCQIKSITSRLSQFTPYQKKPQKKQKNLKKIDKHTLNMTVNQLAQILQIRQSQSFLITQQMLTKLRKIVNNLKQCSVCRIDLQIGQEAIVPKCQHYFHEECLVQWIKRKNTCPTCRTKIVHQAQQSQ